MAAVRFKLIVDSSNPTFSSMANGTNNLTYWQSKTESIKVVQETIVTTLSPTFASNDGVWVFVGILVAAVLIAFIVWLFYWQKRNRRNSYQLLLDNGNRYKGHQQWREAGEAFEIAAQRFLRKGREGEHDAASNFAEAANCYRKLRQTEFTKKAVQCLQRAADMFAEQGHFSIAARYLEDAGDLARSAGADDSDLQFAIQLYERAADTWSGEDSPANAAGSRTKAAELMADCGRLSEAARLFEQLGTSVQSHDLLRFGAKEHMLKSCLCLLCSGAQGVGEKAQQLARSCDSFANSDELSLVTELSAAADALDVPVLDAAIEKFGRFNNIDNFPRGRLGQLRKKVSGEAVPLQ